MCHYYITFHFLPFACYCLLIWLLFHSTPFSSLSAMPDGQSYDVYFQISNPYKCCVFFYSNFSVHIQAMFVICLKWLPFLRADYVRQTIVDKSKQKPFSTSAIDDGVYAQKQNLIDFYSIPIATLNFCIEMNVNETSAVFVADTLCADESTKPKTMFLQICRFC